ncbi:MAG TPA: DUF4159 domain-containing protein [Longimicrobiales bacterium]
MRGRGADRRVRTHGASARRTPRAGGAGATVVASVAAIACVTVIAMAALANRRRGTEAESTAAARHAAAATVQDPVPYDGRFTFARIRYTPAARGFRGFGWGRSGREPPWAHDYPRAERNLMTILDEITAIEPYRDGGAIVDADDPALFRYPVAYLSEAGYWEPSDAEVEALRAYLRKGGFLIFDDFGGRDWFSFEAAMRRVLPGLEIVRLDASHPIFHAFFDIESLDIVHGYRGRPVFLGIFEDNDPEKRLLAIINYNTDIGDYWEWSDTGFLPIDLSNEAYKLGVNYIVYALTH